MVAVSKFAQKTDVTSDRSRSEIERTLIRYNADQFMYGWQDDSAMVGFRMNRKMIRFLLPMPDKNDAEFTLTETGRERSDTQMQKAYEQATRQRWRALALVVKAKLEAVESGITTFEEEFMAHIVLPNNKTFAQEALPLIETAYETGKMPNLLPHLQ